MGGEISQYISLIGLAKAHIDKGFSKVGRTLDPGDPVQRVLTGSASRAIAIANAVAVLSLNNHANEALPLLRSLIEISAHMRWIVDADKRERALRYIEEHDNPDWEKLWPTARLRERAAALGYPEGLADKTLGFCGDFLNGNAAGVPWGHVFERNRVSGAPAEELLLATALAMGHVVKALDLQWGQFAGAEKMWQTAYSVRGNKS